MKTSYRVSDNHLNEKQKTLVNEVLERINYHKEDCFSPFISNPTVDPEVRTQVYRHMTGHLPDRASKKTLLRIIRNTRDPLEYIALSEVAIYMSHRLNWSNGPVLDAVLNNPIFTTATRISPTTGEEYSLWRNLLARPNLLNPSEETARTIIRVIMTNVDTETQIEVYTLIKTCYLPEYAEKWANFRGQMMDEYITHFKTSTSYAAAPNDIIIKMIETVGIDSLG